MCTAGGNRFWQTQLDGKSKCCKQNYMQLKCTELHRTCTRWRLFDWSHWVREVCRRNSVPQLHMDTQSPAFQPQQLRAITPFFSRALFRPRHSCNTGETPTLYMAPWLCKHAISDLSPSYLVVCISQRLEKNLWRRAQQTNLVSRKCFEAVDSRQLGMCQGCSWLDASYFEWPTNIGASLTHPHVPFSRTLQ